MDAIWYGTGVYATCGKTTTAGEVGQQSIADHIWWLRQFFCQDADIVSRAGGEEFFELLRKTGVIAKKDGECKLDPILRVKNKCSVRLK